MTVTSLKANMKTKRAGYLKAVWPFLFGATKYGPRIGLRGWFLVQPVLQDESRRSGGVLGPSLAENRPDNFRSDCLK